jgi:hypothetical protein
LSRNPPFPPAWPALPALPCPELLLLPSCPPCFALPMLILIFSPSFSAGMWFQPAFVAWVISYRDRHRRTEREISATESTSTQYEANSARYQNSYDSNVISRCNCGSARLPVTAALRPLLVISIAVSSHDHASCSTHRHSTLCSIQGREWCHQQMQLWVSTAASDGGAQTTTRYINCGVLT